MEKEESKHGGVRPNSGRKPVKDKKVAVVIYPNQSRIDKLGIDKLKIVAIMAIDDEFEKINKK